MIEWLSDYVAFLAKAATLVVAVGAVVVLLLRARGGVKNDESQLKVIDLNERFRKRQSQLHLAGMPPTKRQHADKVMRKAEKARRKGKGRGKQDEDAGGSRVWVLDFEGDLKASATPALATQISLLLGELREGDEVVLRLMSGGGLVHSYGLAAAQLDRLRDAGARLTVCVDKVAASGGYMMACCAHQLIAAPFAVIGSIGVVAQVPNIHRLLKKHDIDVELLTAGRHKRTLTVLGENTDEGRAKFIDDLQSTHDLFKQYVGERRPGLPIEEVASGEIWYGRQALDKGLVDALGTSEAYLTSRMAEARVLMVMLEQHKPIMQRLGIGLSLGIEQTTERVLERLENAPWQRR
ncbi:protease SohB [Halomonas sp. WWR20]